MQNKTMLYIIGGPSRSGKSEIRKIMAARDADLEVIDTDDVRSKVGDDNRAWFEVKKIIEQYDAQKHPASVLIEGVAIEAKRIKELKEIESRLRHFAFKAAFMGFTNASVVQEIIDFSIKHRDHLFRNDCGGDSSKVEKVVKDSMPSRIELSMGFKTAAQDFGYKFFDRAKRPWNEHIQVVMEYLLR